MLESTLFSLKLTTIFFVCLIFWVYAISSYRMNHPQTLTQSQFLMCSNTAGILLIPLLGGGLRLFLGCFRLHADVSSPTQDQVQACVVGAWSLDYWVTRGVPLSCFFDLYYKTAFRVCCSVVILRFPFPVFKIEAPCLDSHFFPLDLLSHFCRTRLLVLF